MCRGPKAVLPKSTDIFSFGARILLLDTNELVQWKAAGDTCEHILDVVDAFGCTLENLRGDKKKKKKKICLPKEISTTNTSQVM